jgi:hypothetical protein
MELKGAAYASVFCPATTAAAIDAMARPVHGPPTMIDRIPMPAREPKPALDPAGVAKRIGISAAQMARLEANQRGLYDEALAGIAEALRCAREGAIAAPPGNADPESRDRPQAIINSRDDRAVPR